MNIMQLIEEGNAASFGTASHQVSLSLGTWGILVPFWMLPLMSAGDVFIVDNTVRGLAFFPYKVKKKKKKKG